MLGIIIPIDSYFSEGLKPPTRCSIPNGSSYIGYPVVRKEMEGAMGIQWYSFVFIFREKMRS